MGRSNHDEKPSGRLLRGFGHHVVAVPSQRHAAQRHGLARAERARGTFRLGGGGEGNGDDFLGQDGAGGGGEKSKANGYDFVIEEPL